MRYIVRLGNNLFVDMESGVCRRTKIPSEGAIKERLTRVQLLILSYLVENREHVCETGMLQGLFDSSLSGDQTAGIKQQIQRIKNKFRSEDSSFDSQRAREVFKSISGVGYMFHLSDGGELIEAGLPSDALRCLDAKWFAAIKKMDEERRRSERHLTGWTALGITLCMPLLWACAFTAPQCADSFMTLQSLYFGRMGCEGSSVWFRSGQRVKLSFWRNLPVPVWKTIRTGISTI